MLVISNRNYSPDYSLNCTPLGPITITNNNNNNIQLSPEGKVKSGGYIPRHFVSRYISTVLG